MILPFAIKLLADTPKQVSGKNEITRYFEVISRIVCAGSGKIKQHEKITSPARLFQFIICYSIIFLMPETAYRESESMMVSTSKYWERLEARVFAAGSGMETEDPP